MSGKATQPRVCSIVSPNVGETLRLYAIEQEDAMRERLLAYRSKKEQEYEQQREHLMADYEVREWFASHHAELHAWEDAMTAMVARMQEQLVIEKEAQVAVETSPIAVPRSRLIQRAVEEALRETRFKVEKDIVQKYEERREVINYLREALNADRGKSSLSLAVSTDPSVSSSLSSELEILKLEVNQSIDAINTRKARETQILAEHAQKQWQEAMSQLRDQLEGSLASQHRNRAVSVSSKTSKRRRLLMCIEKRIWDLRMYYTQQRDIEIGDSVAMYRTELLRLFTKYVYYRSVNVHPSHVKPLPPTARSLSETNSLDSIWAGKKGITVEYKVKFIQSFLERVTDPVLYEALFDVLQYHIV